MPIEITMPRLSDTMEHGTVVKWNVKEGDSVSMGDVLADIETDKATMELESFDDGVVAKLAVPEGEKAEVGSLIAVLAADGEDASEAAAAAGSGGSAKKPAEKAEGGDDGGDDSGGGTATATETETDRDAAAAGDDGDDSDSESGSGSASGSGDSGADATGGRVFASPLARKIAEERGVDLSSIAGSGPSGRIVKKDVEAAASGTSNGAAKAPAKDSAKERSAPAPAPLPAPGAGLEDKTLELTSMRGVIAKRLVESKTTIPHYQVTVSARLDKLSALREQLNEQLASQGVKLSVNDFIVRACALAMHQHPHVNSSWQDKGPSIKLHGRVNVGVAIALPEERGGGLVVATLRDADRRGLRDISAETKRLAKKAREKGLTVEEMADSTFTISNLGMFGVDHFTAIVNPPNAAILAVGRAIEKAFVTRDDDGEPAFEIGTEMAMTMSSDHRIIDGAMAAQYLGTVKGLLENPAALLV